MTASIDLDYRKIASSNTSGSHLAWADFKIKIE